MLDERIAKRYAKALFELAEENDELDNVSMALKTVINTLEANSDLKKLFMEGVYVATELKNATDEIFSSLSPLVKNFLGLLIEKRRTNVVYEIKDSYDALLDEKRGFGDAFVVSAFPLSEEECEKIKAHLEAEFQRKMRLSVEVDKSLIAGVRIQYKDYVMDTSYKAKLERLTEAIQSDELEVKGTDEH